MNKEEHNKEKIPFSSFLKLIFKVSPNKFIFIGGLLLSLVQATTSILIPKFTGNLIDTSHLNNLNKNIIIILAITFLAQLIFGALGNFIIRCFGERTVANLRIKIWNHLLLLPVSYFDNTKSGDSASRLTNDTSLIKELISEQFPNFISGIITLIGSVVILFITDWKMSTIMLIGVPLVILIIAPIMVRLVKLGKQTQKATAELNGEASEKLAEIRLMKFSNGINYERNLGKKIINNIYKFGVKDAKFGSIMGPLMTSTMMIIFVVILGYGAIRVQHGTLSSGQLVSFLLYLFNIIVPVASFAGFFSLLAKVNGSTARIQEILALEPEDFNKGKIIDIANKELSLNDVNFSYNKKKQTLKDINIKAKPNSIIAFVGPSGGGKSTIFSLIERFYDINQGSITIGDYDINEINLDYWRQQIGYVSQENAILAGSIRENMTYGLDENVSDDKIWECLRLAYADNFVREFPQQLDTEVGERGVKLSGGQKQRIAIARAFLRDPQLLLLDEATANLDAQSENMVQEALKNLMKNRTTIVAAHRLATISDADNIYFIEKGKITGSGKHEELLKSHKLYQKFVKEQII
ncbi:MAG: ABC transporter ATP-binding protein/permease [Bacilli bacterium]|jgi:ATP-binding cassette subfamily B protein AbcA/BmrA|nr:ABC transporter ATP-binding protein/permease [Bacilli bacterium]